MIRFISIAVCLSLIGGPVFAACYTPAQQEADAALRFHATLRVIGLSCTTPEGGKMYPLYQTFTTNNEGLLKDYQDQLLSYYSTQSKGYPTKALHTRETEVENQQSLAAAKQGTANYCSQHQSDLQKAVLASPDEVKRAIQAFEAANPYIPEKCKSVKAVH